MMRRRNATAALGVIAVLLTLTACNPAGSDATPSPSAISIPGAFSTPTPTPTPSAEPRLRASSVIVDGDSVIVEASDGSVIVDIPFTTDGPTAVSELEEAIELAGIVTTIPSMGVCSFERQVATWGDLTFTWGEPVPSDTRAEFVAEAAGPESAPGVKVTTPSGFAVGASEAEVQTGYSDTPMLVEGRSASLHYDVAGGVYVPYEYGSYGARALFKDGVMVNIISPISYFADC